MRLIRSLFFLFLILTISPIFSFAQKDKPQPNWHNLDLETDGVPGIGTERAYKDLLTDKTSEPIIVAVIDGGIDINHEDLKDKIWINTSEVAGDSLDNDANGYIDDVYGWNFIGGKQGEQVEYDNLEVLRLVRELHPKYVSVLPTTPLGELERRDFLRYQKMNTDYMSRLQIAQLTERAIKGFKKQVDAITSSLNIENPSITDLKVFKPKDKLEGKALSLLKKSMQDADDFSAFYAELEEGVKHYEAEVNYHLNMAYDPRSIVGDDYEDSRERIYGNADVEGPDAKHGTHVAGIIGADRDNAIGIKGIAGKARIMALRVVPNGDERDKDVANALFYAVDNGAKVVNMSFGKSYTKDKAIVDSAVRYAMQHDVLLVHAAGNDGQDNDVAPNYPNRNYVDSLGLNMGVAEHWIEVGASGWKYDETLVASFSNYGKRTVDVFAPGVAIHSTIPDSKYKAEDGTSMAAPVVSGVAALIRSYYPQFSAAEVKKIILASVVKPKHKIKVIQEKHNKKLSLADICVTGGIVNAYNAMKLAGELSEL